MANVFQITLADETIKLPDQRGSTYRVGPYKFGADWYVFLLSVEFNRIHCIRIGTTSGGTEVDAVASLKPKTPDNQAAFNTGDLGWEQWDTVIDDSNQAAPAVYVVYIQGPAEGPKPFAVRKFNLLGQQWELGSITVSPSTVFRMNTDPEGVLSMRTFHAALGAAADSIDGALVNIAYTDENSTFTETRPRFTGWRADTDAWSPELSPNFLTETEGTFADVAQAAELFSGSATQGYFRRDQNDLTTPAGELWNQNLVNLASPFLFTPRRLLKQSAGGQILTGLPTRPYSTSERLVAPFVDTTTGSLMAAITPAGTALPQLALELIADDNGGTIVWRLPVGTNTLLGENPSRARIFAIDQGDDESVAYRFREAEGGGWEAGEALHTFAHDDPDVGVPVGAAGGGGAAADKYWYLLDFQHDGGEDDRNVWAICEGGQTANFTGPSPGTFF